jgi:hypothetical protein
MKQITKDEKKFLIEDWRKWSSSMTTSLAYLRDISHDEAEVLVAVALIGATGGVTTQECVDTYNRLIVGPFSAFNEAINDWERREDQVIADLSFEKPAYSEPLSVKGLTFSETRKNFKIKIGPNDKDFKIFGASGADITKEIDVKRVTVVAEAGKMTSIVLDVYGEVEVEHSQIELNTDLIR